MERSSVVSSNIISIGYDPLEMMLEIEFQSGVYRYFSVPEGVYSALMDAPSHGRYFSQAIKDKFSFSRIG
ncbi:KTSC domain-containing protein [Streptomyces sp. NRRL WC-3618]|uniref:KTSC domain-containing protein n=1 Tax=Streptomyces sp. NRRL WC-3618 TaxID=1519490 RepID=UPI00099BA0AF|nr:KTSC domain-containing protein [Streptomyces sp. NRRL WC-3618]